MEFPSSVTRESKEQTERESHRPLVLANLRYVEIQGGTAMRDDPSHT